MSETILLEQFVDPCGAQVLLDSDDDGHITARFDLSTMPRLEPMLAGREAAGVPELVKRLCGICPIPHHLAGVMAFENALGKTPSDLAVEVRRLVAHTASMTTLAPRFILAFRDQTLSARSIAKAAATWSGCPGHFPDVAAPGGLTRPPAADADSLAELATIARDAAACAHLWDDIAHQVAAQADVLQASSRPEGFADVWLVNDSHEPDPLGALLAVRTSRDSGEETTEYLPAHTWPEIVRETHPGATAPRMTISVHGRELPYRTGPLARYAGARYAGISPRAAHAHSIADSLRGIARSATTMHSILGEADSPQRARLLAAATAAPLTPEELATAHGTGVGVVDSPRGLLAHTYQVDEVRLTSCAIHTPTAQNEWWLSHLLTRAISAHQGDMEAMDAVEALEAAIRAADPCVPATETPLGHMGITVSPATPQGPATTA